MFTRMKPETEEPKSAVQDDDLAIPLRPTPPVQQPPRMPSPPRPPIMPPRIVISALGQPGEAAQSTEPQMQTSAGDARTLLVGREITLSGEITHCDQLVVEGSVEAHLTDCRSIDIAESGFFKGSTTIEAAEVSGRFEGDLVVRKRLLIKSTGRVVGTIRYGQIEIECGGQIVGEITAEPGPQVERMASAAE